MVIVVNDHQWHQSVDKIFLRIPLNGVHSSRVDIFISPSYMKEYEAKHEFSNGDILFEIPKSREMDWENLKMELDKNEMISIRQEAIKNMQEKYSENLNTKIKRKNELEKIAVQEAIRVDSEEMEKIENARSLERDNVTKELQSWEKVNDEVESNSKAEKDVKIKPTSKNKFYYDTLLSIESRILPELRPQGKIIVSFTERQLPTPSRESTAKEEQIWLEKLNKARRATGFVSEDLRPEERNPQWCKDKGDEFLKKGNYLGAINAYTHGIKLSETLPSLYSNRAVAQFILGNFHKCIEDCSTALELLVPHCELNLKSRIRCITRRAAALTRVGMLSKAIEEMKCAIKIDPNNEDLKADLYTMERAWEQDPDSD